MRPLALQIPIFTSFGETLVSLRTYMVKITLFIYLEIMQGLLQASQRHDGKFDNSMKYICNFRIKAWSPVNHYEEKFLPKTAWG